MSEENKFEILDFNCPCGLHSLDCDKRECDKKSRYRHFIIDPIGSGPIDKNNRYPDFTYYYKNNKDE